MTSLTTIFDGNNGKVHRCTHCTQRIHVSVMMTVNQCTGFIGYRFKLCLMGVVLTQDNVTKPVFPLTTSIKCKMTQLEPFGHSAIWPFPPTPQPPPPPPPPPHNEKLAEFKTGWAVFKMTGRATAMLFRTFSHMMTQTISRSRNRSC